jgi:hypothetical protein
LRLRILISLVIGVGTAALCWFLLKHFQQDAADFRWAIRAAQHVLAGQNPYNTPLEQYPLTGAVLALPFVWLPPELAAALFYGGSSALLAFGLTRGGYHRLLVFLAYPFWAGILTAQWAPLIAASAFFPLLLPVTLAKPQVGLPVALTHLSKRGIIACAALVLVTLILMPSWPWLWLGQLRHYDHFIPLLIMPGPFLLLALFRYKDKDAWLLFLAALMPQRWFFDTLTLWLIPKTRRELVWTAAFSWGAGIWRWYHIPKNFAEVGLWTVVFIYMPMLGLILSRALLPLEIQPETTNNSSGTAIKLTQP